MTDRDRELIKKGMEAEKREREELIDNLVRSGAVKAYQYDYIKGMTTEGLQKMYRERLDELGYQ